MDGAPAPLAAADTSPGVRIRALFAARLRAQRGGEGVPIAPLLMHAGIAALVCGLARGEATPFGYGVVALSLTGALVAIPLLGEFAYLLREDEAREWVEVLPVRPFELRAARTLHLLLLLGVLALGSLLPAAVLLQGDLAARVALVGAGLAEVLALAAGLLVVQSALGGRAEAVLVAFQTALVIAVVAGLVLGLRAVPLLADLEGLGAAAWTALYPPAWFAAPLGPDGAWLPLAGGLASLALLLVLPSPARPAPRRRASLVDLALGPARRALTRLWVRADERGVFDLVYDAAPREREFVLRTYPMIGIPLAFLGVAALGEDTAKREGFLTLLLFTVGIYLPILLTQLPGSASHQARWLLETSPIPPHAVANGALKAIAVRFLVPLYAVLFALAWQQAGLAFAVRLALPAALLSLAVLRALYPLCVEGLPLSEPPDRMEAKIDWNGPLLVIAIGLTIVAALAWQLVTAPAVGAGLAAGLLVLEVATDRAWRRAG